MIIQWYDELSEHVCVLGQAKPPLGIDSNPLRNWVSGTSGFEPTLFSFCVWGTAIERFTGYGDSGEWWIVRVAPSDDIAPEELETLKASMMDLVRLRYRWTE